MNELRNWCIGYIRKTSLRAACTTGSHVVVNQRRQQRQLCGRIGASLLTRPPTSFADSSAHLPADRPAARSCTAHPSSRPFRPELNLSQRRVTAAVMVGRVMSTGHFRCAAAAAALRQHAASSLPVISSDVQLSPRPMLLLGEFWSAEQEGRARN